MGLLKDTYIVLDVPEPVASEVIELRRRHGDAFRAALPAEVTVLGSSGIGPITSDQDVEILLDIVRNIATTSKPISAAFREPIRFPDSDVFVFPVKLDIEIRRIHERLTDAPLRRRVSPWPFSPHCTIRSRSPISEVDAAAILDIRVNGNFILDVLSIYTTDGLPNLSLVGRFCLTSPGIDPEQQCTPT